MPSTKRKVIVTTDTVANYPEGGGHQSWALQYLLGLVDLGHDARWLEWMWTTGEPHRDEALAQHFLDMTKRHGLQGRVAVVAKEDGKEESPLGYGRVYGTSREEAQRWVDRCDELWDLAASSPLGFREQVPCSVLLDGDPGQLQGSALEHHLPLHTYDVRLTVGCNIDAPDCAVPTLGLTWLPTLPCVYLPLWDVRPVDSPDSPFSTITHWTWGEQDCMIDGQLVSTSKRLALLRYVGMPRITGRPFRLAAHFDPTDSWGDQAIIRSHGWELVDPFVVAGSPEGYKAFIQTSLAEFSCPKPIYRELRTGWFSDRSAAFLSSGRPVIMEETAIQRHIPVGAGLHVFFDFETACHAIERVSADYQFQATAARSLAEEYFDSRKVLSAMLNMTC